MLAIMWMPTVMFHHPPASGKQKLGMQHMFNSQPPTAEISSAKKGRKGVFIIVSEAL